MLGLDHRVARNTWTVLLILLLAAAVYLIRQTLFLFVVAIMFAYLLWPLVHFLDSRLPGRSRAPALAIVYLLLVSILVVLGVQIGSRVASQGASLVKRVPELARRAQEIGPQSVDFAGSESLKKSIVEFVQSQIAQHSDELVSYLPGVGWKALSYAGSLVFLILVPILSFFFLKDAHLLQKELLGWVVDVSPGRRATFQGIVDDLNLLFGKYMRALLVLASTVFVAYTTFYSVAGVPYGLLLAALAFPLEFIPVLGPATSAAIALVVAGLSGYHHMLGLLAFLALYRLFQDYVLQPRLLSRGMELHPLLVIFGVLAGGHIGGIAGSALAVPTLAALRVVYRRLSRARAITVPPGVQAQL